MVWSSGWAGSRQGWNYWVGVEGDGGGGIGAPGGGIGAIGGGGIGTIDGGGIGTIGGGGTGNGTVGIGGGFCGLCGNKSNRKLISI